MAETHKHQHDHAHTNTDKKTLLISFIIIFLYMFIEWFGGIYTNSLALISDAAHMFSDAFALGISLLAVKIGELPKSNNKTFGYKRIEIIVAFLNGLTLMLISLYIIYEAYIRSNETNEVMGSGMFIIAIIGLAVNILVIYILYQGDKENLNIKSAIFHVLGDILGSVGAVVAAILIMLFKMYWADLVISVLVSLIIFAAGYKITLESINILMESKPKNVNLNDIREYMIKHNEILEINDLHVWTINSNYLTLTSHITIDNNADYHKLLHLLEDGIKEKFDIQHTTLQLEYPHQHDDHLHCN